eukprot:CAMPEP_0195583356 /NCGR_PEP_ID=MMETSP0814-20130614/23944_1 /TAXON_ID=97485 /ORGANISM="Prymnesium parvum, Strain Texoma1" /LENGTH=254 /DNA_ID=CAMNT_0040721155 /DNA_START=179 /DNA_END=947 /DNA_ORIENTATION=+
MTALFFASCPSFSYVATGGAHLDLRGNAADETPPCKQQLPRVRVVREWCNSLELLPPEQRRSAQENVGVSQVAALGQHGHNRKTCVPTRAENLHVKIALNAKKQGRGGEAGAALARSGWGARRPGRPSEWRSVEAAAAKVSFNTNDLSCASLHSPHGSGRQAACSDSLAITCSAINFLRAHRSMGVLTTLQLPAAHIERIERHLRYFDEGMVCQEEPIKFRQDDTMIFDKQRIDRQPRRLPSIREHRQLMPLHI